MKAVVLEVKDGHSAVLLEDGTIERVNGEYEVGRTVELREVKRQKRKGALRRFPVAGRIAAAAAAAVIVVSGTGTFYYETAYACTFVSVDVNPSIEFSLNRRDQVIGVEPKNEDAEPIVAMLLENDVKGDTLVEAIAKTKDAVKELDFGDYTIGETYLVDITSDSDARMAKLSREVEEAFREEMRIEGEETPQMVVVTSTVEDRKTAQSLGISTGRYSALKQAMTDKEQDEITTEDVDEYRNKTVKDIVKKTDNNSVAKENVAVAAATTAVSKPAPVAPQPEPEPVAQVSEPEPAPETPAPAPKTNKTTKKKKKSAEATTASTEGNTGDEAGAAASGEAGTGKSGETEAGEAASTGATEGNTGETAVAAATATGEGAEATAAATATGASDVAVAATAAAPAPAEPAAAATAENPAAAATAAEQPAEPSPIPADTTTSNDAGTGSGAATQENQGTGEAAAQGSTGAQ